MGSVPWAGYFKSLPAFEATRGSGPVMAGHDDGADPTPGVGQGTKETVCIIQCLLTACPACGGRDFSLAFDAADPAPGSRVRGRSSAAGGAVSCDWIPFRPRMNSLVLPGGYYSFQPVNSPTGSIRQGLVSAIYPPIGAPEFARPGSMLDIGCGSGEVLAPLLELGSTAMGVEPGAIACEEGRRNGLDIRNRWLIDGAFPDVKLRLCAFIPFV